jgi:hypothetical protein
MQVTWMDGQQTQQQKPRSSKEKIKLMLNTKKEDTSQEQLRHRYKADVIDQSRVARLNHKKVQVGDLPN